METRLAVLGAGSFAQREPRDGARITLGVTHCQSGATVSKDPDL